jgi:RNA polymerase sigma-54 factor
MALSQRLDVRQSQALVMTPQLQQAIKLLQYNHLELNAFIASEIEQNPLLERADANHELESDSLLSNAPAQSPQEAIDDGALYPPQDSMPRPEASQMDAAELSQSGYMAAENAAPLDTDYSNVWTGNSVGDDQSARSQTPEGLSINSAGNGMETEDSLYWNGAGSGRQNFDDDAPSWEALLTRPTSLRDHLLEQVGSDITSPLERALAMALVDHLDEAGYLRETPAALAQALGVEENLVEKVLARLQRFDPPGIFARSLEECLRLQLEDRGRFDPMIAILLAHLPLLANRDFTQLQRLCGCDNEDLAAMIAEIRALNPRPATAFGGEVAQSLIADILMRQLADGKGWSIELNPDTLPRVLLNHKYYTEVSHTARTKQDKEYITERYNAANWLVKSLHQRASTILKVARELVRQQEGFFQHGINHMKPLVLRDIAEAIDMHESTISRVTSNKFMSTPRGIFELKYFFTAAIASADGQSSLSAEAVRYRIKTMIDQETAKKILSDDQIVALLRADGVDIARRTVAKYREALGIASSVQRRREKTM